MARYTRLKAKKARSKYKNDLAYIRAVYRNNKSTIDAAFPPEDFLGQKPFTSFRRYIEDQLYKHDPSTAKILKNKKGKAIKVSSVTKVVDTIARSEKFTSKVTRLTSNALSGMKKFKGEYEKFKSLIPRRDERGRFAGVDPTKLEWDYEIGGYVYDDNIIVLYNNSPEEIKVFTKVEYYIYLARSRQNAKK